MIFQYRGAQYPEYIRHGNACQFIAPAALHFCKGNGLDVGSGKWPLPGAIAVDLQNGGDAMRLPAGQNDFIFSSHCLEHLKNPIAALEHWKTRLKPGGVLFLYLPHPDMEYWLPQNNRKHLHVWQPREMERMLRDLGFVNTIRSERDLIWSFAVVGFAPSDVQPINPDAAFQSAALETPEHIRIDPQLSAVWKTFGAEAFRRSSAWEPEFEAIIKARKFGGRCCVEIGTYSGMTALVLARYFDEVVSLDIFPHTAKHTIAKFLGVKNIRFIDIKNNAEKAAIIDNLDFDSAYVDGDHGDAETDFALVKRCGRVLFHEYWQTQPPVWNLVNRLRADGGVVSTEGKFALWAARNG